MQSKFHLSYSEISTQEMEPYNLLRSRIPTAVIIHQHKHYLFISINIIYSQQTISINQNIYFKQFNSVIRVTLFVHQPLLVFYSLFVCQPYKTI